MSFWDSSAVIPLLVPEPASNALRELWDGEQAAVVWWGTVVECTSALTRRRREGFDRQTLRVGESSLRQLREFWTEVPASHDLREAAIAPLGQYQLHAANALQLAAALIAAAGEPASLPFVALDARLRAAATAEDFRVLPEVS